MTELIITSSVLILVVNALRHFLKGKISLRLQYALWALVLLRLLVPIALFESPFSIMNAVQAATSAREVSAASAPIPPLSSAYGDMGAEGAAIPSGAEQNVTDAVTKKYHQAFHWGILAQWVWCIGIGIVGMTLILSNLSFGRKLRKTRKLFHADNCKLPVYEVEDLPSPCLFGLFRPAIYITQDVAEDKTKLQHVLAHELTHYRHKDHIWSALRCLCLAVHWYNPLVWLAAMLSRRDAELACDESTIKRVGEANRMEYGRTLIGLTCEKRNVMDLLSTATTMTDGKKGIKERIALIAKKPRMLLPALIAGLLVVLVAVGCTFTGAKNDAEIVPLTENEIADFNETFEPLLFDEQGDYSVNPLSHFFTSYYDSPLNINLTEFLRYFPSEGDVTDEAEFEALKTAEYWPFGADVTLDSMPVPIHKFSAATVNDALEKYTGITLDDLSGVGLDELIYLKAYDAYYNFTSDAGAGIFVCTSGETQGDIVRLYGDGVMLTLKIQGDGFLIVSHQRTDSTSEQSPVEISALSVKVEAEGNIPQAVIDYAAEYVSQQVNNYNELGQTASGSGGYSITDAKITGLTQMNTGTAGLTSGYNMYLLEYRLCPDHPENVVLAGGMQMEKMAGEDWITEWGSTGQPYLLLAWDDGGAETSWQRVCVTNTDEITVDYGTPEMLERYGDAFTAAAIELHKRFLEDQETAAHTQALETAIIDFMGDGWWYAGDEKASDFKAAAFVTLCEEETDGSLVFYGVSLYRSYGYSGGGFSVAEDFLTPCIITLDETTLSCTDFWVPGDGAYYVIDIYEKFPADIAEDLELNSAYQYYDQLGKSCDEKAVIYGGIDLSDCCLTITSNSETFIPYENQLWARTYGENGWIYVDGRSVYESLPEISSNLPPVTLWEDFEISYADGVALSGGLDIYDADYERIYHNADMLYLTALTEGTYYVSINVTKQGDYIEAGGDYESFGYECVFRYVVDENSYDRLFMSRPVDDKVCVMLRLTYKYGAPDYILPDEQDVWINAVERAVNTVKEDRHFMESETSLGLFIIWQDEYWQFMDSGALVSSAGRVEPEDAAELYALIEPIAEKYDIDVFRPDMVENLVTATLEYGETFTITDADMLSKLRYMLSGATEIRGGTACPFDALLGLELKDGTFLRLAMATDSCAVYMVNGVYFDYGDGDNTEFFALFGTSVRKNTD